MNNQLIEYVILITSSLFTEWTVLEVGKDTTFRTFSTPNTVLLVF